MKTENRIIRLTDQEKQVTPQPGELEPEGSLEKLMQIAGEEARRLPNNDA